MAAMAKEVTEGGVSGAVETVKGWPERVKTYVEGLRMEMKRLRKRSLHLQFLNQPHCLRTWKAWALLLPGQILQAW